MAAQARLRRGYIQQIWDVDDLRTVDYSCSKKTCMALAKFVATAAKLLGLGQSIVVCSADETCGRGLPLYLLLRLTKRRASFEKAAVKSDTCSRSFAMSHMLASWPTMHNEFVIVKTYGGVSMVQKADQILADPNFTDSFFQ